MLSDINLIKSLNLCADGDDPVDSCECSECAFNKDDPMCRQKLLYAASHSLVSHLSDHERSSCNSSQMVRDLRICTGGLASCEGCSRDFRSKQCYTLESEAAAMIEDLEDQVPKWHSSLGDPPPIGKDVIAADRYVDRDDTVYQMLHVVENEDKEKLWENDYGFMFSLDQFPIWAPRPTLPKEVGSVDHH